MGDGHGLVPAPVPAAADPSGLWVDGSPLAGGAGPGPGTGRWELGAQGKLLPVGGLSLSPPVPFPPHTHPDSLCSLRSGHVILGAPVIEDPFALLWGRGWGLGPAGALCPSHPLPQGSQSRRSHEQTVNAQREGGGGRAGRDQPQALCASVRHRWTRTRGGEGLGGGRGRAGEVHGGKRGDICSAFNNRELTK